MSHITTRQRFIQESMAEGCSAEDALFLADLEFGEDGEPRPGSIYACYREPNA
jgi:hypothetical protein